VRIFPHHKMTTVNNQMQQTASADSIGPTCTMITPECTQHRIIRTSTHALRTKFQTTAPLRTPLPILQEGVSTADENGKWETPVCSRKNVHKPERRISIDKYTTSHPTLSVQRSVPELKRRVVANPAA